MRLFFIPPPSFFKKKSNAAAPLCSLAESVAFRCLLFGENCKSEMSAWKTKSLYTHRKQVWRLAILMRVALARRGVK